ncbi:hypothetical protein Scel_46850 [Streptomyces cellostaticus]|nr:hypothetical protein Scel_46850 [Streptomyces cellostaticus]
MLLLSQYVQRAHASDLLDSGDGTGVGCLLKDRVGQVEEFMAALDEVASGGTVDDPEDVRQLLRCRRDPLERLTPREREVPAPVPEGRSNAAIARQLVVSEAAVGKHIGNILTKLDLPPAACRLPPAACRLPRRRSGGACVSAGVRLRPRGPAAWSFPQMPSCPQGMTSFRHRLYRLHESMFESIFVRAGVRGRRSR